MGSPAIDPEDIIRKLRTPGNALSWTPLEPDRDLHAPGHQDHDRGPIEFLHANWSPADTFDPADAGGGVLGRVVAPFGRLTYRVLGPYFRHQREVVAHLVQANEALERRCDDLVRRQHELEQAVIVRQVAEAQNLSELAVVLDSGARRESDPSSGVPSPDEGTPRAAR